MRLDPRTRNDWTPGYGDSQREARFWLQFSPVQLRSKIASDGETEPQAGARLNEQEGRDQ